MYIRLERVNVTRPNPQKTANWMQKVFDRSIRCQGEIQDNGYSSHIGDTDSYIAI
jgi:hypothetical protein